MKSLPIIWQRLINSDGKTCDRCNATYQEMQRAISKLKKSLLPLGIEPTLEIREIDEKSFERTFRIQPHLDRRWTHGGMARCESRK
jgi:hypothetical protein